MVYTYDYPRPAVTADCIILRRENNQWMVLLIRRRHPPFEGKWALPGGFMDEGEILIQTAARELMEETGLEDIPLTPYQFFDDPGRDPRGRTLTMVFWGMVTDQEKKIKASSDAMEADWFPLYRLPELAFDHGKIIRSFLAVLPTLKNKR
jgi:8-oxo-dGTP diphosphatase